MVEQSQATARAGAVGVAGEFSDEVGIIAAVKALSQLGYSELDACVPRPIEALEDLISARRSNLPVTVFFGGLFGVSAALAIQWFCNGWDYPLNVGGRPPFSLPAFIPISFEMMVLFGSLAAFFGALRRMRLPHLTHPLFAVPDFEHASVDKFWLVIGKEQAFDEAQLQQVLAEHGCISMHWILTGEAHEPHESIERPGAPSPEPEGAPS